MGPRSGGGREHSSLGGPEPQARLAYRAVVELVRQKYGLREEPPASQVRETSVPSVQGRPEPVISSLMSQHRAGP